jgi:hypothetical protein
MSHDTLTSSTTPLTLSVSIDRYVKTGSTTATWTLPPVLGNKGKELTVENRGSTTLTIPRAGSDNLYTTSAVTSVTIAAGSWASFHCDGTYWIVRTGGGGTTLTDSASLAAALSDETGSGAAVFANSPTLIAPFLGTPTSGTLSQCTGLPISSGVSGMASNVAGFLVTPTSSNLALALTDETGSGAAVFANSPTLVTPALGTPASGNLSNCTGGATFVRNIILPSTFSPADATSYFGGAGTSWQSAGGFARMYITSNCTLKKVYGWLQGANGSSETSSMYVRVNNSSDTLISSSIACNAISTVAAFNNTSMSLSLSAGDYIEIKWATPTWATNPTGVNGAFSLEFTQ